MIRFLILVMCVTATAFGVEHPEPIAIFLTWRHDPTHTMTIKWVSRASAEDDQIEYRPFSENDTKHDWKKSKGKHKPLPEGHDDYLIHVVELSELQPDTTYAFRIPHIDGTYKFRTMPATLSEPLRFVVGGDIYHDSIKDVEEMNKVAAQTDPMFVILGGDIAYGSKRRWWGEWDDKDRWLSFLKAWSKTMVTPDGYMIPVLAAIGNHDVQGGYDRTPGQAPFFYALFGMPGYKGFNVVDFGDYMSAFLLDSGHTFPVGEEQTAWLDMSLKKRKNVPNKFAVYHVGAYPSYRSQRLPVSAAIRKWWVPLFEKYSLTAAFEHHDHTYKRTHLIKNDKIDPQGVLYLGDGSWGTEKPRQPQTPQELWYLARSASVRQFILVTLHQERRLYQAITNTGLIIDEYNHPCTTEQPRTLSHLSKE